MNRWLVPPVHSSEEIGEHAFARERTLHILKMCVNCFSSEPVPWVPPPIRWICIFVWFIQKQSQNSPVLLPSDFPLASWKVIFLTCTPHSNPVHWERCRQTSPNNLGHFSQVMKTYHMYHAESISAESKLKEAEKQEEKQIGRSGDPVFHLRLEERHQRRSSVKKIEKMKEKVGLKLHRRAWAPHMGSQDSPKKPWSTSNRHTWWMTMKRHAFPPMGVMAV